MTPSPSKSKLGTKGRILLAIVFAAVLAVGLGRLRNSGIVPTVPQSELVLRDGKIYQGVSASPFSGVMEDRYPDGSLRSRARFEAGVMEGFCEGWHTNGNLQVTETFQSGVSDGIRTKWYPSGAKLSESTIVKGRMEGVFRAWHENGQLAEEIAMKDDQPFGEARAWYPSGFLKAAIGTNLSAGTEHKNWPDGERRRWPDFATNSP
jgi:antitoxin component YwqK of YwqJK toxin-antitoxin module